jgi:CRP/FNR family cyclic AMP-dependent transcriptional regulator
MKMLERFQGTEGKKRLISALAEQKLILGDLDIASAVADKTEICEFESGTDIIIQNACDSDIFLIISGSVTIFINNREIAKRTAGDHIGEMAFIDPSAKRSATVKTNTSTIVAKIPEISFAKIADHHPSLWRRITIGLANRLREREKFIKKPNDKPLIFIASSKEYLPFAEAIQQGIASKDRIISIWSEGIFEVSCGGSMSR